MLITRGFGTCYGTGTGETVYVPIKDATVVSEQFGSSYTKSSESKPKVIAAFSEDKPVLSGEEESSSVRVTYDDLKPVIRSTLPKF